ncbi:hypothetical protein FISHEDRAFT_39035, partial [Fistulina hepatica ATCC 64428]
EAYPESAAPSPYWSTKRHLTCGNPTPALPWSAKPTAWRPQPGKLKTAHAALVLCLNIDVDPPDIVKTKPCAALECWVDPHSMPSHKALEAIGNNLKHQFEGLSLKIPYKPILDPSFEDLRRFCMTLRKQAKDDAVLFYYNGHGVPKPTASGELWCFNRDYTQYIPVSLQEVQTWLGSPGVYIWDCSAAGHLLQNFNAFAKRRDADARDGYRDSQPFMSSLQLAACAANEQLPSCPELPADLFTSCLTSPIDIALRFFLINNVLPDTVTADMVMQLPGDLKDRKTPLGELNWIFTAITDTIAWTTFSKELFTRLYRCDLLIACLFRNFLLAERIMKNYSCTPHTYPPLPPTNTHPLWATWDLVVDTTLRQLPELLYKQKETNMTPVAANVILSTPGRIGQIYRQDPNHPVGPNPPTYVPSRFFSDQLTAFEVWISRGGSALTKQSTNYQYDDTMLEQNHLVPRKPPDQLPIVLQVLLSQPHRLRALILLSQFVDLGPWAVNLVLAIGIFPYISKLLQAAGQDLRPVLIFIWARILAVDPSVQVDLCNSQGYKYFSNILGIQEQPNEPHSLPNSSEHKAMCAFILSSLCRDFPLGHEACRMERVFEKCYERLEHMDYLLRQWATLCIAQMWDGNDNIRAVAVDLGTQDKLLKLLGDDSVEVRAAALYALGTFLGASGSADPAKHGGGGSGAMLHLDENTHSRMEVAVVIAATLAVKDDASPMVRKELLVVISCLVKEWRGHFVVCAWLYWEEDRKWRCGHHPHDDDITNQALAEWLDGFTDEATRGANRVILSSYFTIFVTLLTLSVDPYPEVATYARTLVDYIMVLLLESPFTRIDMTSLDSAPAINEGGSSPRMNDPRSRVTSMQSSPTIPPSPHLERASRPGFGRSETVTQAITTGVASTMKRTQSFANALKSFANIAFPSSSDDGRLTPTPSHPLQPSAVDGIDHSRPPSPFMNSARYVSPYSRTQDDRSPSTNMASESRFVMIDDAQPPMDFLPCDVMEALTEEDLERLRARRRSVTSHIRQHSHYHHHHHMNSMPSPSCSTFSGDSTVILGLGTGASIRDVLPFKSTFYDWCLDYFKEPQMRQAEPDEPGSVQYTYQVWRQDRNERVLAQSLSQVATAKETNWNRTIATIQTTGYPITMAFHSYDQQLVIVDDQDIVSIWDWKRRHKVNHFPNGNPKGFNVTSLHILNQDIGGIILTAAADASIRLYRNYDPTYEQGPAQLVSAFRGLNEIMHIPNGAGVITDWNQTTGVLLVGGDAQTVKVWDAQTETSVVDLDTNAEAPLTSMVTDYSTGQTFIAGFADGSIRLFDRRLEDAEEDGVVRTYKNHTSWIQNVRWHPQFSGQFISASLDGEVKLWDIRGRDSPVGIWDVHPAGLSAFDVHPLTPVFAASSAVGSPSFRSQKVIVQNFLSDRVLSNFTVPTGLATQSPSRAHPVSYAPRWSSLVFHPKSMLYGLGSPDGTGEYFVDSVNPLAYEFSSTNNGM